MKRNLLKLSKLAIIIMLIGALLVACTGNNEPNNTEGATPEVTENNGKNNEKDPKEEDPNYANGLPKDKEVVLKIAVKEAGYGKEWVELAMERFTEQYPNVTFDPTYSPKIEDLVSLKVNARDDEDMFHMFTNAASALRTELANGNFLVSQEHLWDRELLDTPGSTVKDIAIKGEFDAITRYNGHTMALAVNGSGAGLWFNKKLFEENGWNLIPETWDEFLALMEDIKSAGIAPLTFPGQNAPTYLDYSFGPFKFFEIANNNGNAEEYIEGFRNYEMPYYTAPEQVETFTKIYELGKAGYFVDGLAAINHTQAQMQVIQGDAAMVPSGTWIGGEMADATPEGFEWGFMGIPIGDDPASEIFIRHSVTNGFYIWNNKPELEKNWALEFSLSLWNMDVQEALAKAGAMPVRKDFNDDPARVDLLQGSIKAMSLYMSSTDTRSVSGHHDIRMTHPTFSQSEKLLQDNYSQFASGKVDPLPLLKEAEKLLEEAHANQEVKE